MNWIKKNNKFVLPNNNINYNIFKETIKDLKNIDDSYIYIPTHNINDIYEWYRLFFDSYAYSDNFDKYGFGIHGWFSKERGQSIDGWFPNLFEVKASTSNVQEYYIDVNNDYFKRSVDFLDSFSDIHDLNIDGVDIEFNDIVLIKNQHFEELYLFDINQSYTNNNNYYIKILPHEIDYFKLGNNLILKDNVGNYHEDKILDISYTNILSDDYIIIKTEKTIENIIKLADVDNGLWLYNTIDAQNGVYYYDKDFLLKPIIHMYDRYETYSQIIYTYLGETNQNKEFYLRRNGDITSPNYTKYPYIGQGEPLYYSEGSSYLIKCKFNYDLSIEDNSNDTIDPNCCACNLQIGDPHIAHPTTSPPYDINSTAFRLLFLDNSTAEKVFSSYDLGVGEYKLDNLIDINDPLHDISFYITDDILNDLYYNIIPNSPIPITITNNFKYQQLNSGESYEILFDDYHNNNLKITQNYTNVSTTVYGQTEHADFCDSTTLHLEYTNNNVYKFPTNVFNVGDYLQLEIIDNNLNETILNHTFIVKNSTTTNAYIEVEIFQPFTKELIDELTLEQTGNIYTKQRQNISFKISSINTFGLLNNIPSLNRQNLLNTINKSIIGEIYEFTIIEDGSNPDYYLSFEKIRQNLKHKYFDLKCDITFVGTPYVIDSAILADYREYFYGYNIKDYLKNYLGLQSLVGTNSLLLPYLQNQKFIYENNILLDERLDISGSNKNNDKKTGNIITYGRFYKENVLDNIKKHTLVKIEYDDNSKNKDDVFIYDKNWSEELNYGKIILSKEIPKGSNGENIKFVPYTDVTEISKKLKIIFDKKLNNNYNNNHNLTKEFPDYKIQTMSYAYAFMNYANGINDTRDEILNNITATFYNSYNELQTTFFKRDRNFDFPNDEIIDVMCGSIANIDINNLPNNIDGYILNDDDIILIKDQTIQKENGIYTYNNGVLTRYEPFRNNIYWNIVDGNININKTFVAYLTNPFIIDTNDVIFVRKSFRTKSDPRLTLTPVELYKLGVDNNTKKTTKINSRYDMSETFENIITLGPGTNTNYQQIRFIDGLTEENILNDINDQGQYSWILDENTHIENAIVGCTQTNGPGTGDLIWYTGTWIDGIWCYGIWIQGIWLGGTWLDGIRKSNKIIDNYSSVSILNDVVDTLSVWHTGVWYNGINESGIFNYVEWHYGTFNNGLIIDGVWMNGIFNNGIIEHILWENGNFNGGIFKTGEWLDGIFDQSIPTIESHFGYGSLDTSSFKDLSIWRSGLFKGGHFHSGLNSSIDKLSIWYSGKFTGGIWHGGTFIFGSFSGVWNGGIWIGGYYINNLTNTTGTHVKLEINPKQYDSNIGLDTLTDYKPNIKHNINKYNDNFILYAISLNPNNIDSMTAYINMNYLYNNVAPFGYVTKNYISNTATDISLELDITDDISNAESYSTAGTPILLSKFNGTFENGTWLQGYFGSGEFQAGIWVNGFFNNGDFGLIEY